MRCSHFQCVCKEMVHSVLSIAPYTETINLYFSSFTEPRAADNEEAGSLQYCQASLFLLFKRREGERATFIFTCFGERLRFAENLWGSLYRTDHQPYLFFSPTLIARPVLRYNWFLSIPFIFTIQPFHYRRRFVRFFVAHVLKKKIYIILALKITVYTRV